MIISRYICASAVTLSFFIPSLLSGYGAAGLSIPNLTVGQHLQANATITLGRPVPREGLQITVTSNDPKRIVLSSAADRAGSASIVLKLQSDSHEDPEFYVQALGDSGSATYTASAPGFSTGTATVTLAPSGFIIQGPFGPGETSFMTTLGAEQSKINVSPALLDASLKYVATQALAGGQSLTINLTTSNGAVGKLATPKMTLTGGSSMVTTSFQPTSAGETTIAVAAPPQFKTAQFSALTAKVLALHLILEDALIGQNLETPAKAMLSEPAPAGGVTLTLVSSNPSQLLLSAAESVKGSPSLTLKVPAGQSSISYYLQALGNSGKVTYTASAPGFASNTRTATLAPSGVVIAGPTGLRGGPPFIPATLGGGSLPVTVYTAVLNQDNMFVEIQPLSPVGPPLNISLKSSNPAVGTVPAQVTIRGGSMSAVAQFTPVSAGSTTVSVLTPAGLNGSKNRTSLTAQVKP